MHVLFINGTVGAGKTTTMDAMGTILRGAGIPHALIDLDGLRNAWPAPDDDPFNIRIAQVNLAAMSDTYRQFGAQMLVVAGVLESLDERDRCEAMIGSHMTVVRLRPYAEAIRERLWQRHHGDDAERDWHLDRAGVLDNILDEAKLDDAVVEVGRDLPLEVAKKVLASAGFAETV